MALTDTAALVASLELEDKFSKTADKYAKTLSAMDSKTSKTTSTLGKIGQQTQAGLGKAAHNLRTVGLVAGGVAVAGMVAATKAAIDFESAFTGVVKTVDEADLSAAGLTFEDLSNGIREMSRELPIAATELAAIGEQAGALGIAGQDILEFTRVVALIGTTTDVSTDAAATALGQLSNVLNLTAEDYDNFGAALVDLGNKGASTESQILEITRRFGATGAQAGLSAEEVLAFSSAAANLGLQSELAGGALQRFFIRTQKFVQSGDINLQNMAETAGLTKQAFADLFAEDASAAILKFIQGMEGLEKSERAAMLASLEFSNQTGLNQLLSGLSANADNLSDSLQTSADGWRENTALTAEAEKRFATTESSLQILRNNLTDIGITIGSAVLPKVAELSKEFTTFLQGDEAQSAIKGFAEDLPGLMEEVVGFAKSLPWDTIKTSFEVMAIGSRALLTAFTSMPPWVQTAVLTGWGLNKLTGGALGNIAGILTKAAFGSIRGGTPATPVFTKEVGIGGGPGGAPVGGGALRGIMNLAGLIAAPVVGGLVLAEVVRAIDPETIARKEDFAKETGAGTLGFFGGKPVDVRVVASSTPLGQFVPENRGGTRLTNLPEGGGASNAVTFAVKNMHKDIQRALARGDIEQARLLKQQVDALRGLDDRAEKRNTQIIAGLGKTHAALTTANRALDDGNARQRELAQGIREARDRIGSGFAESNRQLGAINAKDFSPEVNVTVPVTSNVSINDIVRAQSTYNVALSIGSQTRNGFKVWAIVTAQLLVRQGGGAADEVDIANLDNDEFPDREGVPFFDHNTSLIMLGQRWEQGTAAQGSFTYIDPHANHTHQFRPHATVKLVETALSPDAIIAYGRIEGGNDTRRRSSTIGGDEVEHSSIGFMDCNRDLFGLPFITDWWRPAEDSWDRLQALHAAKLNGSSSTASPHRSTTNLGCDRFTNGHLVDATDPVELTAKNYPSGTTVEDVMMDIMEQWGKGWGVTIHHGEVDSHRCILVQDLDDLTKFTSELRISDDPADWAPDHGSAPTKEPHWRRADGKQLENSHVISGLLSKYRGTQDNPHHVTVSTGEAPEDWEIWWDVYEDDLADGEVEAERRANNILNDRKRPYTTNMPSILLNPNQVKLITAGQAIEVKSVVMNQGALKHEWVWRRIAQIDWEPSVDGRWWAHLELDRPRGSRPRVGGSQPGSTAAKPAPEQVPDPGDTLYKFYNADDPGGDSIAWTGILTNQGGTADGANGTDYYNFKSSSPTNYQNSWAATAGTVYRVSGWVNSGNVGRLRLAFATAAVGTAAGTWEGTIIESTLISPVTPGSGNTWISFASGAITAPVGTVSGALGRSGGSVSFDEVSIFEVADPVANDEFAVDYGDFPHDSPFYLPSNYVEARLDEMEDDIPHLLADLNDVDEADPADGDVLTWNDANEEWEPAAGGGGGALDDLTDVDAPSPADADVLTWDSGASEWVAAAPSGSTSFENRVIIASHYAFTTGQGSNAAPTANQAYIWPVLVPGSMRIRDCLFHMQAAASGTYQWGLFDVTASATAATKLAGGSGALNGTGWRSIAPTGAPVDITAGQYIFIMLAPAANLGSMYRSSNFSSGIVKTAASYSWDDTPDLTTGWSATTQDGYSVFLKGDLNTSVQW